MAQITKEDVDMDLANTQPPPQRSASSMTSERGKSPSSRKSSPARLMAQPFAHYPPQVTRHDTRNSRRAAEAATEAAAATAPTREEGPRESRWDRSHRPSNKKKSTSPGRTKQAAVEGMDAARHQARATTVDSKRSTSRNAKVRASATTAQPTRKAGDRGQSPYKTMRTEDTRGVATPIARDDPPDAANAAYDVCFNATDVDKDVPATFHEAMHVCQQRRRVTDVFEHLQRRIHLNDLDPISKLLGMEIDRDEKSKSMYVTLRTYIERMAIKYGMDKSKRVDTSIPA
ncbi:hypothetical protein DYB36_014087, partial [Aphanomyces astaci]